MTAGALGVNKGKLESINNFSGHYRPTPLSLYTLLVSLKDQGVNFDSVKISVMMKETEFRSLKKKDQPEQNVLKN